MKKSILVTAAATAAIVLGLLSPKLIELAAGSGGAGGTLEVEPIRMTYSQVTSVELFNRLCEENYSVAELDTGREFSRGSAAQHAAILTEGFLERCGLPYKDEEIYRPESWSPQPLIAVSDAGPDETAWNAVIWTCECARTDKEGDYEVAGCAFDDATGTPVGFYVLVPELWLQEDELVNRSEEIAYVFADMMDAEVIYIVEGSQVDGEMDAWEGTYAVFSFVVGDEEGNTATLFVSWQYGEINAETGEGQILLTIGYD